MAESPAVDVAMEPVLWASFSLSLGGGVQSSFTPSERASDVTCRIYFTEGCKQKGSC